MTTKSTNWRLQDYDVNSGTLRATDEKSKQWISNIIQDRYGQRFTDVIVNQPSTNDLGKERSEDLWNVQKILWEQFCIDKERGEIADGSSIARDIYDVLARIENELLHRLGIDKFYKISETAR